MIECFENFFQAALLGILLSTSAAIVDRYLNPPESLAKSEAEPAAERVAAGEGEEM